MLNRGGLGGRLAQLHNKEGYPDLYFLAALGLAQGSCVAELMPLFISLGLVLEERLDLLSTPPRFGDGPQLLGFKERKFGSW